VYQKRFVPTIRKEPMVSLSSIILQEGLDLQDNRVIKMLIKKLVINGLETYSRLL